MFRIILVSGMLLLRSNAWSGAYYVCTDTDGKKTFQDKPCSEQGSVSSEKREYTPQQSSEAGQVPVNNKLVEELFASNRLREVEREIKKSERAIDNYSNAMTNEVSALRRKKQRANNNLAGAQWETSISNEMTAITNKYSALIETERDKLKRLRDERAELKKGK